MAETIASFMLEMGFSDKATKAVEKLEKSVDNLDKKLKRNSEQEMRRTKQMNEMKRNADLDAKQRMRDAADRVRKRQKAEREATRQQAAMDAAMARRQMQAQATLAKMKKQRLDMQQRREEVAAKFILSNLIRQRVEQGKLSATKLRSELMSQKNLKAQRLLQAQIVSDERSAIRAEKEQLRIANQRLSVRLKERAASSAVQLAGGAISAFAAAGFASSVVQTGRDVEAFNNAMLAASKNADDANKNLEFVRQTSRRLGIDLVQTGRGFSQFLAAGQGKLAQEDIENVFLGVAEASRAMGLSMDDTNGTIRAITQIMSKGKVNIVAFVF